MNAFIYAPKPKLGAAWWIALAVFALLCVKCWGDVRLELVSLATNKPAPFDFTAATPLGSVPATAYWNPSNTCYAVTFRITGEPGVYDLQWNYALGNPHPTGSGIEGHAFVNVYPPITNSTGTVTVTYPAKPSPQSFWRLKKRT